MRSFNIIAPALWDSTRFQGLPSCSEQLLFFYFLTCKHQNSAGCFRLPDAYACSDLQWPLERYLDARAKVEAAGLIEFDLVTSEIMITRWFKHNLPTNPMHLLGTERLIEAILSPRLREAAIKALIEAQDCKQAKQVAKRRRNSAPSGETTAPSSWPSRLNTPQIFPGKWAK